MWSLWLTEAKLRRPTSTPTTTSAPWRRSGSAWPTPNREKAALAGEKGLLPVYSPRGSAALIHEDCLPFSVTPAFCQPTRPGFWSVNTMNVPPPPAHFLSVSNKENSSQLAWAAYRAQSCPIDFKLSPRHSAVRTHVPSHCAHFSCACLQGVPGEVLPSLQRSESQPDGGLSAAWNPADASGGAVPAD